MFFYIQKYLTCRMSQQFLLKIQTLSTVQDYIISMVLNTDTNTRAIRKKTNKLEKQVPNQMCGVSKSLSIVKKKVARTQPRNHFDLKKYLTNTQPQTSNNYKTSPSNTNAKLKRNLVEVRSNPRLTPTCKNVANN